MYFANKTGILEFNGKRWNLYPLKNKSDARSLFFSRKDNRIYVGGINEIGYLETSSSGEKQYYSLASPNDNPTLHLGNIWKIFNIDETIYFCGDQVVVKLLNGVLTPIQAPDKIDCSSLINNTIYIGTASGIYLLAGETFYRLPYTETMTQKKLRAILPFNNKVMIATAREGLFLWDEKGLTPFHTEADNFMSQNELFSIAVQDNQIAIGTVLKGLVLITTEGKILKYINELHGLQNNTILSVYFDFTGNLWLGLDNGIGYVALNYPITNLYAASGFYGAGYVARLYKGKLYLGTNRGLFVTDWPVLNTESAPELKLIPGSQGQVWNLHIIDDRLFVCHDKGLFVIDSEEMKSMDLHIGIWEIRPVKQTNNKYFLSTYNGFYMMEKDKRRGWKIHEISSSNLSVINGSIINFEEGNGNQLFLRQSRDELTSVLLNNELNRVENERNYRGADIPEDFSIHQLMGKIVLCSPAGFYFCNSNGKFVPDTELNRFFEFSGKNNTFRSVLQTPTATWALGDDILAVKYHNSAVTCYHSIPLNTNFERIFPVGDSLAIIPNENGFALWNTAAAIKKPDSPLQITDIRIIKGNRQEEKKLEADANGILKIPYRNNSILVEYNLLSYFNPYKERFRTRLDDEEWSPFSDVDNTVISDLRIGSHIFRVETQLETGNIVEVSFSFTVLPPWYLTPVAYAIYGTLLLISFFFLWKLDSRRIEQKERQMKVLQEKELEIKEEVFKTENEKKEQEIIRLTNEKLEMDIRHKSQELANSAIILGNKNEVLIEIKKALSGIFDKSGHETATLPDIKRKLLEVSYIIDENIREDDILSKFEENFDLVHNNFIKRLAETFPTLSVAERKMCTLIKMQLSSKEIAPLLNITVRGVETMRLRLRKKLGLQNESLTKFLTNF